MADTASSARFRSHWAANISDTTPHTTQNYIPPAEHQSAEDASWIKEKKTEPPVDFSTVPAEDADRTIVLTNIDPGASNARILDFLAFAGRINAFAFGTDAEAGDDGSRERHGWVTYDEDAAFQTALLFSGAQLLDTHVSIVPYTAVFGEGGAFDEDAIKAAPPVEHEGVEDGDEPLTLADVEPEFMAAAEEDDGDAAAHEARSRRSIIAMLLAAGFVLSASAVAKAKAVDEGTLNLADKSSAAWAAVADKAKQNAAARGLGRGVSKIRFVMGNVLTTASAGASSAAKKAGLGGFMAKVSSSAAKVKDQTKAEIKKRQQG